jgi:hypothetical protein
VLERTICDWFCLGARLRLLHDNHAILAEQDFAASVNDVPADKANTACLGDNDIMAFMPVHGLLVGASGLIHGKLLDVWSYFNKPGAYPELRQSKEPATPQKF